MISQGLGRFFRLRRSSEIAFEDDLGSIVKIGVHIPVAIHPEYTGKLDVAVGEGIERSTVLVYVGDLSDTADTVEGRRPLDDRYDSVVQLWNAKDLIRVGIDRLLLSIWCVRHTRLLNSV